jgi:hypothetical protein
MMATRTRKNGSEIELVVEDGRCGDGCGAETAKGRSYKQGHDAKLKSILGRAHKAGQSVAIVSNGTRTTSTAEVLLLARGWPVPAIPESKAPKPKAAPKRRVTAK